jgi:eukaryotic-like serine/threonine-protein kinase
MIGALLDGRYQVVQELGAGGFGQTFLAQDQKIPGNPTCVVKQLKPLYTSPEQLEFARQLFQREAETLAKLGSHDQIPRLLAYFTEGNEFYLVQDYVEGQPLEAELGTGQRWDERQVMHLLQELLPVLVFVHDQGVIHRDLKPANVIRRRQDNKLVLIDFGAIKQIQGNAGAAGTAMTGTRIGTMGYMSPEQGRGKPQVSSDLYALGMMGIQGLTGKTPSQLAEDPDTGELIWQNLVTVNPGLAAVLTQMVRYDFRDRYKNAVEVLQAIQPLVTIQPSAGTAAPTGGYGQTVAATQVVPSGNYGATVAATQVSMGAVPELTLEWMEAGQTQRRVIRPNQPSRSPGVVRIGRDPAQCDIVLTDVTVSGLHVEVLFDPQQKRFVVRNLRQNNLPLVDGKALADGTWSLTQGTMLRLGQTDLRVVSLEMQQYPTGAVPPVDVPPPIPSQPQPVAATVNLPQRSVTNRVQPAVAVSPAYQLSDSAPVTSPRTNRTPLILGVSAAVLTSTVAGIVIAPMLKYSPVPKPSPTNDITTPQSPIVQVPKPSPTNDITTPQSPIVQVPKPSPTNDITTPQSPIVQAKAAAPTLTDLVGTYKYAKVYRSSVPEESYLKISSSGSYEKFTVEDGLTRNGELAGRREYRENGSTTLNGSVVAFTCQIQTYNGSRLDKCAISESSYEVRSDGTLYYIDGSYKGDAAYFKQN